MLNDQLCTKQIILQDVQGLFALLLKVFANPLQPLARFTLCQRDHGPHGIEPQRSAPGNLFMTSSKSRNSSVSAMSDEFSVNLMWPMLRSSLTLPSAESSEQQNWEFDPLLFLAFSGLTCLTPLAACWISAAKAGWSKLTLAKK